MAEEQHDGGVFIGNVNLDRGPSCAERNSSPGRCKFVTECFEEFLSSGEKCKNHVLLDNPCAIRVGPHK